MAKSRLILYQYSLYTSHGAVTDIEISPSASVQVKEKRIYASRSEFYGTTGVFHNAQSHYRDFVYVIWGINTDFYLSSVNPFAERISFTGDE